MQTVKVRLRKPNRVFTFTCNGIALERNTPCIVRSDRGLEYGVCVVPPEDCDPETEKRFKMSVVRQANHHDITTFKQIQFDEDRVKRVCRDKIRERELPMKLVESEYSFDRKKITFYFTADDRVDFRELVRDLAAELKARIELRHIQVRDEAKMLGGIGTCGRELCCTTWLGEFMPISMKMAKKQNLSLNPTKISGQCGRLMCCLSYENEMYGRAKRSAKPPAEHLTYLRDEMEHEPAKAVRAVRKRDAGDRPRRQPGAARTDLARVAETVAPDPDKVINVPVDQPVDLNETLPIDTKPYVEPPKPPINAPVDQARDPEQVLTSTQQAAVDRAPEERKKKRRRRKKNRGGPKDAAN